MGRLFLGNREVTPVVGSSLVSTAILGYPTGGEALSDSILYNYIKGMYDTGTAKLDTNYTIVGSPTINNHTTASGFSANNAVVVPTFNTKSFAQKASASSSWSLRIKFNGGSSPSGFIFGGNWGTYLPAILADSHFSICLGSVNTTYDIANYTVGTYTIPADTDIYVKLEFTGTKYILSYSLDGDTYTTDIEVNNSSSINAHGAQNVLGGAGYGTSYSGSGSFFNGTIYINECIWEFEGVVYSGYYIPYRYVKSGSKVVDSAYSTIIDTLVDLQGYALYYTIDTINQTVTLPRGDIFGFITQAMQE